LQRCARSLGADVPFFLRKGLCLAGGIGDQLRSLPPLPPVWMLLVYPGFGVATKAAYAKVKLPFKSQGPEAPIPLRKKVKEKGWSSVLFNRFEELVFPDHPELPVLKDQLLKGGAVAALMSGSGSSVFGLFPSKNSAFRALRAFRKRYPQSWLVRTVNQS
jgi:4-diphosphocytidyl-2-C-methyl-D-erythritol kinase